MSPSVDTKAPLPPAVTILMVGACAAGTSEFMPSALLPGIAAELHVSIPEAGSVVSSFALGMIIGALSAAVFASRFSRKAVLISAFLLLAAGHLLGANAGNLPTLLGSRVVSAIAAGVFWTVATEFAVAVAPEQSKARAIARLLSGMVVANVAGVPIGAFVGDHLGWRATFLLVAVVAGATVVTLAFAVDEPARQSRMPMSLRDELGVFLNARLLAAYAVIIVYEAAVIALLTFIKPLLQDAAGFELGAIPWLFAIFGASGFVGLQIGGRFADTKSQLILGIALLGMAAATGGLAASASIGKIFAALCLACFGVCAFMAAPALNARAFMFGKNAPTLASGGTITAFNIGNILGPSLGGAAIFYLGETGPAWVAGALALTSLGLLLASPNVSGT